MAWFSSFFDTVQCEAEQPLHHDEAHTSKLDSADKHNEKSEPNEAAASENEAASKSNEEEKEEKAEGGDAEEEEEPEPEDHCQEKVNAGEGFKGEDCVEEFMMHCVDNCIAPKLFAKLK
ncbi:hypothetical protein FRB97_009431 [Tulasnella sp. 331]|nr:hypothetical protein FRB97_009431 [Tulasnella sp. 331]